MIRAFLVLLMAVVSMRAAAPVYVVLWFDTEDYIEPAADDAALRIAKDLSAAGVRATFKVVGEKARVLQLRGRRDVIEALQKHAIGYHSNWHSVHPAPAEYLERLGFLEGADEFERRERAGVEDVRQVFGTQPICYGQPGNSWGPQAMPALRRMGVPVYLDEGEHIGLNEQPFWYGGMLNVFNMGQNQFRARLDGGAEDLEAARRFDQTVARLSAAGGGVISIYYHPTEFVTTEFWDGVNFAHGANPPRSEWVKPRRRTAEESERCYGVLSRFVAHMKSRPDVRFVGADELAELYGSRSPEAVDRAAAARSVGGGVVGFREVGGQWLSAADLAVAMLGLPPQVVSGPTAAGSSTVSAASISRAAFDVAVQDAAAFVRRNGRLPNEVFVGSERLSLVDFVATLAGSLSAGSGDVKVVRGRVDFERYFATDPRKPFDWVIHPETFTGAHLLELARMQGWTLKPARLRTSGRG